MRNILEWKGKVYSVESCATCPARMKDENGKPYCEIRNKRLRANIKGLFPTINFTPGSVRCPVRPEIKKRLGRPPKLMGVDKILPKEKLKISLKEKPKIFVPLFCSWCGNKINPMTAVIIINDKEPDRIYDRFECLSQYLRTN